MYEEKTWRQFYKNAMSFIEQSGRQHHTKQQLYGHLPHISKTIQVRRTSHAEHCWRSKDELISNVLLWIPSHGRAKVGRSARTYIQQLCASTGCSLEDLHGAMDDRDGWREDREIHVSNSTWWWWWWYINGKRCTSYIMWNLPFPRKLNYLFLFLI